MEGEGWGGRGLIQRSSPGQRESQIKFNSNRPLRDQFHACCSSSPLDLRPSLFAPPSVTYSAQCHLLHLCFALSPDSFHIRPLRYCSLIPPHFLSSEGSVIKKFIPAIKRGDSNLFGALGRSGEKKTNLILN